MSKGLRVISDFTDYYDTALINSDECIEYRRIVRETPSRWKELKMIADGMGIKTIPIEIVGDTYGTGNEWVVVYLNENGHGRESKTLLRKSEAAIGYPYKMCSKYHIEANNITFKFLQVGKRRFNLTLKNENGLALFDEGRVIDVKELIPGYNYILKEPIFSIDYIMTTDGEIAVDFDRYPNLSKLNFMYTMNGEEVAREIVEAIQHYSNK